MTNQSDESQPLSPPPWIKMVKLSIFVMSILIVLGIGLLVYGLAIGIGSLEEKQDGVKVFTYPKDALFLEASGFGEDKLILRFMNEKKQQELLIINLGSNEILQHIRLEPETAFEFKAIQ